MRPIAIDKSSVVCLSAAEPFVMLFGCRLWWPQGTMY